MSKNTTISTEQGDIELLFIKCLACDYHDFCYKDYSGKYHKETPRGLMPECAQ